MNSQLKLETRERGGALPGDYAMPITFPKGRSELVIAVTGFSYHWGFYAELVNGDGKGPPKEMTVSLDRKGEQ